MFYINYERFIYLYVYMFHIKYLKNLFSIFNTILNKFLMIALDFYYDREAVSMNICKCAKPLVVNLFRFLIIESFIDHFI